MPNRVVRDGILKSARVNALSLLAELFYRRLMSVVDDFGRYEANLEILRAMVFPRKINTITNQDVDGWLNECTSGPKPLITVYVADGESYLQINNFQQRSRSESKFPAPPLIAADICPSV